MDELDRLVVGDEQPPLDERREHARDARVLLGVELAARRAPARERLAVSAGDEPEQDPPRDLLLLCAERPEGRLGVAADGAADAARALVARERQRRVLALVPEIEQSRREQRQRRPLSPATSSTSASTSAGSTSRPARSAGPSIARRSSPRVIGPSSTWFGADEIRQLDVRREAAEEVRAQRDEDRAPAARDPRPPRRARRRTLAAHPRRPRREHLLELVDRDDEPLARRHAARAPRQLAAERSCELRDRVLARTDDDQLPAVERRHQPGAQQRRLAAPGRADDREQRRAREPRDELVDQPLAPEEELGVGGVERREPLERADVPRRDAAAVRVAACRRGSAPGPGRGSPARAPAARRPAPARARRPGASASRR